MQLKTSYFNGTVLKKDVTRFAPLWGLYLLGQLMVLLVAGGLNRENNFPEVLVGSVSVLPAISMIYAFCTVQVLMGDLYSTRMCNALHAFPMRREGWLLTHGAAGLAFSMVPNLIFAGISAVMLGSHWNIALWWMVIADLEYLFFFGLSLACSLLVGSRFAHLVVYGLVNGLTPLAFALATTVYQPLLYGIRFRFGFLEPLCPVARLTELPLLELETYYDGNRNMRVVESFGLGEGWGYLAILVGAGILLMAVSALLYRRRKLEKAGDFMAVSALNSVFLVIYTGGISILFQAAYQMFFGRGKLLFLAIGLTVGYFTGRMLLERQVNVFRKKNFLWFGVLAAVVAVSIGVTKWDPLGVTRWVPQPEQVQSVCLSENSGRSFDRSITLSRPEEVEDMLKLHRASLEKPDKYADTVNFSLHYRLKDGSTVSRYYEIAVDSPILAVAVPYMSRTEYLLGIPPEQVLPRLDSVHIYAPGYSDGSFVPQSLMASFTDAFLADCRAGTMVQSYSLQEGNGEFGNVEIAYSRENEDGTVYVQYEYFTLWGSSRTLCAWITEHAPELIPETEYYK